jgi:hypothetical protein
MHGPSLKSRTPLAVEALEERAAPVSFAPFAADPLNTDLFRGQLGVWGATPGSQRQTPAARAEAHPAKAAAKTASSLPFGDPPDGSRAGPTGAADGDGIQPPRVWFDDSGNPHFSQPWQGGSFSGDYGSTAPDRWSGEFRQNWAGGGVTLGFTGYQGYGSLYQR